MKFLNLLVCIFFAGILFTSCQKGFTVETESAKGLLAKNNSGDCAPIGINGAYKKDTLLNSSNFVDVQVNITTVGIYTINTDTLNGYYFKATGVTDSLGSKSIRLMGLGKPIATGTNIFSVKFGSSVCKFNVMVSANSSGGNLAAFTLGNNVGLCTNTTNGTYAQNLPTNNTNTVTVSVSVQTAGSYSISTPLVNGVSFTGAGNLTLAANSIILTANGTPTTAGQFNYPLTVGTSSCNYNITYTAAIAAAVFGFNCNAASFAGTYQVGTPMNAGNTLTVPITVTTPGTYAITSNVNGVSFSGSGVLTLASSTLTLTATGIPNTSAAPSTVFTLTGGGGTSCSITIPFTPAGTGGGDAVFGYICSRAIISGTFQSGLPLTNLDFIKIPVFVGTSGVYSLTSTTINGVTFSATGNLIASFDEQYITLTATGQVPTNATTQSVSYNITGTGGFNCSIVVPFTTSVIATDYIKTKIDGSALINLNTNLSANIMTAPSGNTMHFEGAFSTANKPSISITLTSSNPIVVGTYNQTSTNSSVFVEFHDYGGNGFYINSGSGAAGPFSLQITSITSSPNRITGTFFGSVKDNLGTGSNAIVLTSGNFSVPY